LGVSLSRKLASSVRVSYRGYVPIPEKRGEFLPIALHPTRQIPASRPQQSRIAPQSLCDQVIRRLVGAVNCLMIPFSLHTQT